jgi:hypothetical protein
MLRFAKRVRIRTHRIRASRGATRARKRIHAPRALRGHIDVMAFFIAKV